MRNDIENNTNGSQRLMSIDAVRGFVMLWIIGGTEVLNGFAKATGDNFIKRFVKTEFEHHWGEFHFYDVIMPLFLFIVGVVMPFSFSKRLSKERTKKQLYKHIIERVILLYILGLISSGHLLDFDISTLHLYTNALHAIAVGYLVSSILILEFKLRWQITITACLLFLYWGILAIVPVPGHGANIFEPTINLPLYIDNKLLGHFQEGMGWTYILTSMTFVGSVMEGVFAGMILKSKRGTRTKLIHLVILGISCIILGKIWGIWFPIIHQLWTSSMVLYSGGWCYLILAAFYLVIDVWKFKKWAFFLVVIGMNAISVYVATEIFDFRDIGSVLVGGVQKYTGIWYPFILAIAGLSIVWLILYWMYKKETFIKI